MATRSGSVRVLVTGAGGPSAISVMKSLGRLADVELYAADIDRHAAGLYLVPSDRRHLLPRGDDAGFAGALLALSRATGIDVLFPTVDTELEPIARNRAAFQAAHIALVLADVACLRDTLDKWRLAQRCDGRVPLPRTELHDGHLNLSTWRMPVIIKPRFGSGSRDVVRLDHPSELARFRPDGSFIVQEYLPGEEYSIDVLADPAGGVLAAVPRIRLKVDSGVAVAGVTLHDRELDRLGRMVASAVGLSWVGNVQCRRDARGVARLLEVNPRFPGSMPLTVAAGIDMPRICLDMALGRQPHQAFSFADVAIVRYLEERVLQASEMDVVPDWGALAIPA